MIHIDTHVAAWLYAGEVERFPAKARGLLETETLVVSPMAVLELQYLYEVKRTSEPGEVVLAALRRDLGLRVCDLPFEEVVLSALGEDWTRDPFDRFIVSQAALASAPLLTRDRRIHGHYGRAVWTGE